ncbi:hypothetical protein [Adlercreutzia sp. ZJ138]|uniref:hypothetical protein n=1 Tax=Adlercreutzia sp. ZJ138 TaxID=2709405 RepID=UPI0013ED23D1|nr:hypothetical protein [Adlercreutzia sp. ZJ138]
MSSNQVLSLIFIVVAVVLTISLAMLYKRIVFAGTKPKAGKAYINEQYKVLRANESSPSEKGSAFVSLITMGQVLVHTLVNSGKKYDDGIQTKSFLLQLTDENVSRLMSLGGDSCE